MTCMAIGAFATGVAPVPVQTGENWWFPRGMANAVAAECE